MRNVVRYRRIQSHEKFVVVLHPEKRQIQFGNLRLSNEEFQLFSLDHPNDQKTFVSTILENAADLCFFFKFIYTF